ncbi:MAG: hypothetical protein K8M05_36725 [Deltaproteobacteria bacterium]|nr:hypothetical protein [Kofleriaceae bacterium]
MTGADRPRVALLTGGSTPERDIALAGATQVAPALRALDWRCEPAAVDGFEDAKLAAIAEYRSQVATFGGMDRLAAFVRRGHAATGGEPIWRA